MQLNRAQEITGYDDRPSEETVQKAQLKEARLEFKIFTPSRDYWLYPREPNARAVWIYALRFFFSKDHDILTLSPSVSRNRGRSTGTRAATHARAHPELSG